MVCGDKKRESHSGINSLPAIFCFCHLLITFTNSLDQDLAVQNAGPVIDPFYLTL